VLGFERRGRRTVLTERRFALPLQALEAMDLETDGAALMLLNPTGGVLGGDRLETRVRLGAGSRVCLTTPSATRVYRSPGEPAVQRFSAILGEGARLEYMPDHVIPSPGARLRQSTEIALAAGASALIWDAWSVGRPARDETWAFAELDVQLGVRDARGPILHERARLRGSRFWDGLGGAEGMAYVGAFVAAVEGRTEWDEVRRCLSACLETPAEGARGGVTALGRGGVLARVLAPSAPVFIRVAEALWAEARRLLFGLPALGLRKL
jgi:urease accessory protein